VRSWFDWSVDVALVALIAAASVVAAVAVVLLPGLVLGGSACGGAGDAQRCTGIARQLSLVETSPRAWAYVGGAALCAVLASATLLLARAGAFRIVLALSILSVVFLGLVQTARIDAKLGPSEGTYGRSLEDWGPFLAPALLDLRRDALRRYAGARTEPGGPLYDREQILDSFSVRPRDGWRLLYAAVVVAFFSAGMEAVRRFVRRPSLALLMTASGGIVVWAAVVDRATVCDPDASDCYSGIATLLAFAAASLAWLAYLTGLFAARVVERIRMRLPGG
jgi:hypothetical protein